MRRFPAPKHQCSEYVIYYTILYRGEECLLVWGRGCAYLDCSGQSLFNERENVDDPIVTFRGPVARNRHNTLVLLLWWVCLGPRISVGKPQVSQYTTWIEAVIDRKSVGKLTFSIPAAYIGLLRQVATALLDLLRRAQASTAFRGFNKLGGRYRACTLLLLVSILGCDKRQQWPL